MRATQPVQRDPFVVSPEELSDGAEALLRHLGSDSEILSVDERSLAMASCHAVRNGARLFVARARDYGLEHIPLPDGQRLHGVLPGTRLTILSDDMERAVRISTAIPRHTASVVHLGTLLQTHLGHGTVSTARPETGSRDGQAKAAGAPEHRPSTRSGGNTAGAALESSIDGCPVVSFGQYQYFVHPLSDGVPYMEGGLLAEAVDRVARAVPDCDKLATAVSMGVPLAAPAAMTLGKPLTIALKHDPVAPGQVKVSQSTGYSKHDLWAGGVRPGERVVIVDDVLSTGGTTRALVDAVRRMGGEVVGGVFLFNKLREWKTWQAEVGVPLRPLFHVEVVGGRLARRDWD